jgi:hypothetical protein
MINRKGKPSLGISCGWVRLATKDVQILFTITYIESAVELKKQVQYLYVYI